VACERGIEPPSTYAVTVLVEGDPATPLASASILREGVAIGSTGPDGRATVRLGGAEGEEVSLSVRCPVDYTSPTAPIKVPLRRLADPSRLPSYRVSCPPENRTVVVAVRAVNGANLPVFYLGKEMARTDASGAAHVELRLRPGQRFELTIGTQEPGAQRLIPQNPTAVFVVKDQDELLFFDQRFDLEKSKLRVQRGGPRQF
jgi:hypothetical protein